MPAIQNVSVPRSGHQLLIKYLANYFDRSSDEPDWSNGLLRAGPFTYCESYLHCGVTPCPNPSVTLQKSHDLELGEVQYHADRRYIIQTRRPLPAITSHYLFSVAHGRRDSRHSWERFFRKTLAYWEAFQKKWVLPSRPNVLVLEYDQLVADPFRHLQEVLSFCEYEDRVDCDWLSSVTAQRPTFRRDKTRDFKYFREQHARLAAEAEARIASLGNRPVRSEANSTDASPVLQHLWRPLAG